MEHNEKETKVTKVTKMSRCVGENLHVVYKGIQLNHCPIETFIEIDYTTNPDIYLSKDGDSWRVTANDSICKSSCLYKTLHDAYVAYLEMILRINGG